MKNGDMDMRKKGAYKYNHKVEKETEKIIS